LCIIEWPERAGELLGPADLTLTLEIETPGRRATLEAHSPAGKEWLASARSRFSSSPT
jgi:tRNA threonylcarbamoyladenosine biosynthesis protein TsaE